MIEKEYLQSGFVKSIIIEPEAYKLLCVPYQRGSKFVATLRDRTTLDGSLGSIHHVRGSNLNAYILRVEEGRRKIADISGMLRDMHSEPDKRFPSTSFGSEWFDLPFEWFPALYVNSIKSISIPKPDVLRAEECRRVDKDAKIYFAGSRVPNERELRRLLLEQQRNFQNLKNRVEREKARLRS